MWDKRAQVYVDVLAALHYRQERRALLIRNWRFPNENHHRETESLANYQVPDFHELEGRILAFATQPVISAIQVSSTMDMRGQDHPDPARPRRRGQGRGGGESRRRCRRCRGGTHPHRTAGQRAAGRRLAGPVGDRLGNSRKARPRPAFYRGRGLISPWPERDTGTDAGSVPSADPAGGSGGRRHRAPSWLASAPAGRSPERAAAALAGRPAAAPSTCGFAATSVTLPAHPARPPRPVLPSPQPGSGRHRGKPVSGQPIPGQPARCQRAR
jgi:hypothetical protein